MKKHFENTISSLISPDRDFLTYHDLLKDKGFFVKVYKKIFASFIAFFQKKEVELLKVKFTNYSDILGGECIFKIKNHTIKLYFKYNAIDLVIDGKDILTNHIYGALINKGEITNIKVDLTSMKNEIKKVLG